MKHLLCFFLWITSVVQAQHPFRLIHGTANEELAKSVAKELGIELTRCTVSRFNDGEIRIQILENLRNSDVYVLQSTCFANGSSVNDMVMETYLMVRALKRASVSRVTAIIPYFGYARQDRKTVSREPISASDVAMLLELAGVDQVISIDLHSGQIQGFFHQTPVDNLYAATIFVPAVAKMELHNPVVVSPDAGGVTRAKRFSEALAAYGQSSGFAVIVKQRMDAGVIEKMNLVGQVAGCDAIIVDDICDTAGTLVEAAKQLKAGGARRVFACITHPLLTGPACKRIAESQLDQIFVTDTIPLHCNPAPRNLQQLSVAPLIAQVIERTQRGESISELFQVK